MGIKTIAKTNKKATLKLINHINSYLFEEQYGEFENQSDKNARAFLKQLNELL